MNGFLDTIKQSKLNIFFILLAFCIGSLILIMPVQQILILVIGVSAGVYLLLNPKISYFLLIFTASLVFPVSIGSQELPFNYTDILIGICAFSILLKIFLNSEKVDLSTKLDSWLLVLFIIFTFSGLTSLSHRGYQGSLNYLETVALFYLTVYFLRTKTLTISSIIRVMIFTGIFQATIGILQGLTGSFGANFQSERNLLGYIGIGSKLAWHGRGLFEHFNAFGPFMFLNLLLFIPIHKLIVKNKTKGRILLWIMLAGLYVSYSRGSWMGLIFGLIVFAFVNSKNKIRSGIIALALMIPLFIMYNSLMNSDYVSTISPRDVQWSLAILAIMTSTKSFLFGYGLKAYNEGIMNYLPGNVTDINSFYAHNFILGHAVEIGVPATLIVVSFYLNTIKTAYGAIKHLNHLKKAVAISIVLIILAFILEGMFDHAIKGFCIQIWLFILLGIFFSFYPPKKMHEDL